MSSSPPVIFSVSRRLAARRRAEALRSRDGSASFVLDAMAEDALDRLGFVRHEGKSALLIGDCNGLIASGLEQIEVKKPPCFDFEQPWPVSGMDLIAWLGAIDTLNDVPGALIHARRALAPGGLFVGSFTGAGSLPALRNAMLTADGDRPAPRLHPQIDVRAGAQLLQRAGFADPVADGWTVSASYRSLGGLVADLRAQAFGNVLAHPGPPLTRTMLATASQAFADGGEGGRTVERFEVVTLTGWRK